MAMPPPQLSPSSSPPEPSPAPQMQDYSGPNIGLPSQPSPMQYQPQYPADSGGGSGGGGGVYEGSYAGNDAFAFKSPDPFHLKITRYISIRYQLLLDASTPHWAARWTFSLVILLVFMLRIVLAQGWYVICYGLSIYYLNLFISFLSPKIDPAFQPGGEFDLDDPSDSSIGPMLPTRASDEFKPFIRRLPEFKFWLSATKATLFSLFLTLFEVFDLPVFWPILLLYFILLFISMMRQQIRHMIKYGYVPWDKGKKKYGGVQGDDSSRLFSTTI